MEGPLGGPWPPHCSPALAPTLSSTNTYAGPAPYCPSKCQSAPLRAHLPPTSPAPPITCSILVSHCSHPTGHCPTSARGWSFCEPTPSPHLSQQDRAHGLPLRPTPSQPLPSPAHLIFSLACPPPRSSDHPRGTSSETVSVDSPQGAPTIHRPGCNKQPFLRLRTHVRISGG